MSYQLTNKEKIEATKLAKKGHRNYRRKQKKGKDKHVPGPAFHEKKEKNKKVNLGGPAQKEKLKGKDAKIRTYRRN